MLRFLILENLFPDFVYRLFARAQAIRESAICARIHELGDRQFIYAPRAL